MRWSSVAVTVMNDRVVSNRPSTDSFGDTDGPSRAQLLAAAVMLVTAGVLLYGPYVLHGGFYGDDWSVASEERLRGFSASLSIEHGATGGRPLSTFFQPLSFLFFGLHPALHLAAAVALGIATSLAVFAVLRMFSMPPLDAGAIALLSLLFPWSDSVRLWNAGAMVYSPSMCFFLVGLLVALYGLRLRGAKAVAAHGVTVGLYMCSVLTYEAAAAVAAIAGLSYIRRAPPRVARRCWFSDVVAVAAALSYEYIATVGVRGVGSPAQRLGDVRRFVRESAQVLASAVFPTGSSWLLRGLVLLGVGAVLALGIRARRRVDATAIRYWLWVALASGVAIAAAYFMFIGSYHYPAASGGGNRINVVAGFAYCALAYATIAITARLIARGRTAATLTLAAAAAIAVGYAVRLLHDESSWTRAWHLQHVLLASIDHHLLTLPRHSTLITFGFAAEVSPGVPIFDESWDLKGAARLQRRDWSLSAYPAWHGVDVQCHRTSVTLEGPGTYSTFTIPYGRLYFLDEPTGAHAVIATTGECLRALKTFRPGPYFSRVQ
jgi:MFS family permease